MVRTPKDINTFDVLQRTVPGVFAPRYAQAYDAMKKLAVSCTQILKDIRNGGEMNMKSPAMVHYQGEDMQGRTALLDAFYNYLSRNGVSDAVYYVQEMDYNFCGGVRRALKMEASAGPDKEDDGGVLVADPDSYPAPKEGPRCSIIILDDLFKNASYPLDGSDEEGYAADYETVFDALDANPSLLITTSRYSLTEIRKFFLFEKPHSFVANFLECGQTEPYYLDGPARYPVVGRNSCDSELRRLLGPKKVSLKRKIAARPASKRPVKEALGSQVKTLAAQKKQPVLPPKGLESLIVGHND
jgi:hypothetical protein